MPDTVIEALEIIALHAYWAATDSQDCGGAVADTCKHCQHYDVCKAAQTIDQYLTRQRAR